MEIYTFILLFVGMVFSSVIGYKVVSAKTRPKRKDIAQSELNSVYEGTIRELKARVNSQRQRIYSMESGADRKIASMDGDGDVDEIESLYNEFVPKSIQGIIPFSVAKQYVEDHPDVVKKVVGKFKKEGVPAGISGDAL